MENQTTTLNVNVDKDTIEEATKILKELGLDINTSINIFLTEVVKRGDIPFKIKNPKPNREMRRALKEAQDIIDGKVEAKGYHDVHQMFEDILNEN